MRALLGLDMEQPMTERDIKPAGQSSGETEQAKNVDQKERRANEFRFTKLSFPPTRSVLQVIRAEPDIWEKVEPRPGQEQRLTKKTAFRGESHRIGAALFANIYRNEQAAALYDVALYDATKSESDYFKEKIRQGVNYTPVSVVGAGGVYGTIFSAAALKENPDSPTFGFEAGKRRGGIWGVSGDVTLDKAWWRMNSRNRPEDRDKLPLPGSEGNLNSLGAEIQNLQVPDISSAQYPTNNELGRVLSHDNFLSNNITVDSELVKVRLNKDKQKKGKYIQEYQDTNNNQRFFVYTDKVIQATGLGREDLGFSRQFSSTQKALKQVEKDIERGVETPRLLTFLQLVEATTSNRTSVTADFKKFGLIGKGDTSKVIREYFIGIGGIDPGLPTQEGFVEEVTVFGLEDKTREELARSERARYVLGLLELERTSGGFFRIKPIEGRVVGVGIPKNQEGLVVYYRRTDETPEGLVTTIGTEIVPRLVTAAGFEDMSDKIYSGLTSEEIVEKQEIERNFGRLFEKSGSTIYYDSKSALGNKNIDRVDIINVFDNGRIIEVVIIDKEGNVQTKMINREDLGSDEEFFNLDGISKLELAGDPPRFEPFIDSDYDEEIPVAEKAQGCDIYKIGACTSYPVTEKEKRQTSAYRSVPENTKSIFRFVRPVVAFAKKVAKETPQVEGALNLETYRQDSIELSSFAEANRIQEALVVPIDPKNEAQKLSSNLRTEALLKYLALSRLTYIFPEGIDKLSFGVKKVKGQDENSPSSFIVEINPPIPESKDWTDALTSFLSDPLLQRTLLRLTPKSTSAAELEIGIKRRMVDIGSVGGRSVKATEENTFYEKYQRLKDSK